MSYDMIDRFLRNNLGDDDYAEYSAALDSLCAAQRTWVGLTDEEISARAANFYNPEMYKRAALWAQEKLKERNQ